MGLAEITQGKAWKNFMAKLYGIGAAVVILGALFKIMHFPGAGPMLVVGLGTEAVIFFFSAFEPIHEETDWSLVYPELAHIEKEEGAEEEKHKDKHSKLRKGTITQQLDMMLAEAKIGPDLIESLGLSMRSLSDSTSKMTDITDASVATNEYTEKVKVASESMGALNESYTKNNDAVSALADASAGIKDNITNAASATSRYSENMTGLNSSLGEINTSYSKAVDAINAISTTGEHTSSYNEEMQKITKNLSSLNSMYELDIQDSSQKLVSTINALSNTGEATKSVTEQMQQITEKLSSLKDSYSTEITESNERVNSVKNFYSGINDILQNLNESADGTRKYKEEVNSLSENLSKLNTMYETDVQESSRKLSGTIDELASTGEATKPVREQLQQLMQHLATLNSSYGSEIEESHQRVNSVKEFYTGLHDVMQNLNESADSTKKYKMEVAQLGENLAALNQVYGNMLSAMNINVRKKED